MSNRPHIELKVTVIKILDRPERKVEHVGETLITEIKKNHLEMKNTIS